MKLSWESLGKLELHDHFQNFGLRAVYPSKIPEKPKEKSNDVKRIFFIGGVLMTILYFQKNQEKIYNIKD